MIAKTIIQQLGNIALSMLGAHTLIDLKDGLQFHIQDSKTVDVIQIILDPCDTYTMKFWKIHTVRRKITEDIGFNMTEWQLVRSLSDVYFDMLHDMIEEETGLYVRF